MIKVSKINISISSNDILAPCYSWGYSYFKFMKNHAQKENTWQRKQDL